jgi:2-polyprenyl-3-methyl-5-hydroxy-6-metoxy-1,4-benzoquinol methylase
MNLQQVVFRRLYRTAPTVEALPWHRDEPPPLLERAITERSVPGRALDLGCGDGVYAVHLAQHGYSVVATDFVEAALDATRERAEQAGVDVRLHQCDVLDYQDPEPFDIVLDSGCLHHLPKGKIGRYRSRLDEWLVPGGSFVLVHFLHRPMVKWIPQGPRHLTRSDASNLFAPFELQEYEETDFEVPFPMGRMRAGVYWFTRPTP